MQHINPRILRTAVTAGILTIGLMTTASLISLAIHANRRVRRGFCPPGRGSVSVEMESRAECCSASRGIRRHRHPRRLPVHRPARRGSALLVAPLSSHLARRHGARLTLAVGTVITLAAYALRGFLSPSAGMVISWTTLASIGIAIGYATLPLLIIANIEPHETAAANGLNALLRAVGTAVASAFVAAIGTTLATGTGASTQPSWEAIATVFAVGSVLSVVTLIFALAIQGRTKPASGKTALHRPRLCAAIVDRRTSIGTIIETGTDSVNRSGTGGSSIR
ncbi:MFS transporter [Streptomyces pristinaespiralis]|uniref:MFS transporter n=1 Tax=Streptomyces pristinaespiralis TaxID=38300 RepID=UPI0037B1FDB4